MPEPSATLSVRLPYALYERLHSHAIEHDLSLNVLIIRAIQAHLDQVAKTKAKLKS